MMSCGGIVRDDEREREIWVGGRGVYYHSLYEISRIMLLQWNATGQNTPQERGVEIDGFCVRIKCPFGVVFLSFRVEKEGGRATYRFRNPS